MQQEIEVKFLAVDHDAIRAALRNAGGTLEKPMRLMRRTVFDHSDGAESGYLRVRDEGDRITMTFKRFTPDLDAHSAYEVETTVGDYDTSVALFEAIGMKVKSVQESKRETWRLGECEVVLDEWPWLKPYIEIEGPSTSALQEAARQLGLDWNQAKGGSVTTAYRDEYDIPPELSIGESPEIRFDLPVPEWLATLKRKEEH